MPTKPHIPLSPAERQSRLRARRAKERTAWRTALEGIVCAGDIKEARRLAEDALFPKDKSSHP